MNEEQQPPIPPVTPEPQPTSHLINTKLEDLPKEIKDILHGLIKTGYGAFKTKSELEKKFPIFNDILPASRSTYQAYIDRHYDELEREIEVDRQNAEVLRTGFENVANLGRSILGGDNISAKEKLKNLISFADNRLSIIRELQSIGIPSAALENSMSTWASVVKGMIESGIELGEQLNKEDERDMFQYMEWTIVELIDKVNTIYQSLHGDSKFKEFSAALEKELGEILRAAKQERQSDNGTAKA